MTEEPSRTAVEVAEAFADGLVSEEEREDACIAAADAVSLASDIPESDDHDPGLAFLVASAAHRVAVHELSLVLLRSILNNCSDTVPSNATAERLIQTNLFRDIFGNPFRPVAFDPQWRTSTVVALAQQMYESRDFSAMPILADALQDAGCDNDNILTHCRDANGVHVRGCWVVDMILGKE